MTITQETGILDVKESEYHISEGISKSSLDKLGKSPLHYKHALENPTESTPAMAFGSLVHCVVLEPSRIEAEYAVAPKVDKRTKAGKAEYAEFLLTSEGKIVVSQDDMDNAYAMAESIQNNQLASTLMCQTGVVEKSIYSVDPDINILKRGRCDKICENAKMIIDLKTTQDGSPKGFQSSIFKFNYHVQVAYYIDLCREQGLDIERFLFVVVEKTAPFATSVYELDEHTIELGRREYKERLATLSRCLKTDVWDSYSNEIITIETPNWIK